MAAGAAARARRVVRAVPRGRAGVPSTRRACGRRGAIAATLAVGAAPPARVRGRRLGV
jgi:hypothetical protein